MSEYSKKPLWVADNQASACSKCLASFGTLRRKHHCRQCGCIFCNECSSARISLPHLEYAEPVRVCKCCYDINTYASLLVQSRKGGTDNSAVVLAAQGFATLSFDGPSQSKMIGQGCLPMLISMLSETHIEVNQQVTLAFANISKNAANRMRMVETGLLDYLLPLLWQEDTDRQVQLNICTVLEGLACLENEQTIDKLVNPGLELIIQLSHCQDYELRLCAATILFNLSYNGHTQDTLVEHHGVEALISLALVEDPLLQILAAKALACIAEHEPYQRRVAQEGALVPLLLQLASSEDVHEYATLALANLAENSENQAKIISVGGIRTLFSLLPSKNPRVLQNVTKALANLSTCTDSHNLMSDVEIISSLIQVAITSAQPISQANAIGCLANLSQASNVALRMKENTILLESLKEYASDLDCGKTRDNALIIQQAIIETKNQRLSYVIPLAPTIDN